MSDSNGDGAPTNVFDLSARLLAEIRDATRLNTTAIAATNDRLDATIERLDATIGRLDRHEVLLERLATVAIDHTQRLDRLTEAVAQNGEHIRVLAAVVDSGFRQLERRLDERADNRRVEALEARVDRLEARLAG